MAGTPQIPIKPSGNTVFDWLGSSSVLDWAKSTVPGAALDAVGQNIAKLFTAAPVKKTTPYAAAKVAAKKKAAIKGSGVNTTTLDGILAASGGGVKDPGTRNTGFMPVQTSTTTDNGGGEYVFYGEGDPRNGYVAPVATSVSTPATTATDTGTTDTGDNSVDSAYSALLNFFEQQKAQLNQRYADNAANINSIFGTLSTVRAQDIPKIQQQYATSLKQQQDAVAQRMALQNAEAQQGRAGAATAASELGSGDMPVPTSSASGAAYTASNTDANAYQTTWNALQQVMSAQQQENVRSSMEGYDYQKVATLESLQRDLEDRLMAISGNQAQTMTDIANAKLGAQAAQASSAADAAALQQKLANDWAIANLNASTKLGAAGTSAAARRYAADVGAASRNSSTNYSNDIGGWTQKVIDAGGTAAQAASLQQQIDKAYAAAEAANTDALGNVKKVSKYQIMAQWKKLYRNKPGTLKFATAVQDYIDNYSLF